MIPFPPSKDYPNSTWHLSDPDNILWYVKRLYIVKIRINSWSPSPDKVVGLKLKAGELTRAIRDLTNKYKKSVDRLALVSHLTGPDRQKALNKIYNAEYKAANRDYINAKERARKAAMSPEEKAILALKQREHSKRFYLKNREKIAEHKRRLRNESRQRNST